MTNLIELKQYAENNKKTGNKYQTIDTEKVLDTVSNVLVENNNTYTRREILTGAKKGTEHAFEYTLENEVYVLGDAIKPRITIVNSFNGERAMSVHVGFLRLVCLNGMTVGESCFSERIVHVKGETLENKIAALKENISKALNYINSNLVLDIEKLLSKKTTLMYEVMILNKMKLSDRLKKNIINKRKNKVLSREEDRNDNLWCLYNVINEQMRFNSRSELGQVKKNLHLMDQILEAA